MFGSLKKIKSGMYCVTISLRLNTFLFRPSTFHDSTVNDLVLASVKTELSEHTSLNSTG